MGLRDIKGSKNIYVVTSTDTAEAYFFSLKDTSYKGSMSVGAWPIVRAPDSAAISSAVSPLSAKAEISSPRLISGPGKSLFAKSRLAVVESLLPN